MPGVVTKICLGGESLQIESVAFELCLRIVFQRDAPSLPDARFRGDLEGLKFALIGVESFGLPTLDAIFVGELVAVEFCLREATVLRAWAVIANPVEGALGIATAGDEIKGALRAEIQISEVEWLSAQKDFSTAHVGASTRSQVNGQNAAVGPVENKQCFLVVDRELAARAELQTGWGTLADCKCGLGVVRMIRIIRRPTARHSAPAEIGSASEVLHLGRAIPRGTHVKLSVGIISEGFAVGIKRNAVWVAQAGTKYFLFTAVWIHSEYVTLVDPEWLKFPAER